MPAMGFCYRKSVSLGPFRVNAGQPVRLRFVLADADLFAMKFNA